VLRLIVFCPISRRMKSFRRNGSRRAFLLRLQLFNRIDTVNENIFMAAGQPLASLMAFNCTLQVARRNKFADWRPIFEARPF
jgi:hypothetical protein